MFRGAIFKFFKSICQTRYFLQLLKKVYNSLFINTDAFAENHLVLLKIEESTFYFNYAVI